MLKANLALRNYVVSVGLVILATGLTWFAWLHNQAYPYPFYYLVAVLASYYGGWRADNTHRGPCSVNVGLIGRIADLHGEAARQGEAHGCAE